MNMLLVNLRMLEQTSGGSSKRKLLVEDYSNWGCVLFVFFFLCVCVCVRKGEPRIHQFPNWNRWIDRELLDILVSGGFHRTSRLYAGPAGPESHFHLGTPGFPCVCCSNLSWLFVKSNISNISRRKSLVLLVLLWHLRRWQYDHYPWTRLQEAVAATAEKKDEPAGTSWKLSLPKWGQMTDSCSRLSCQEGSNCDSTQ